MKAAPGFRGFLLADLHHNQENLKICGNRWRATLLLVAPKRHRARMVILCKTKVMELVNPEEGPFCKYRPVERGGEPRSLRQRARSCWGLGEPALPEPIQGRGFH